MKQATNGEAAGTRMSCLWRCSARQYRGAPSKRPFIQTIQPRIPRCAASAWITTTSQARTEPELGVARRCSPCASSSRRKPRDMLRTPEVLSPRQTHPPQSPEGGCHSRQEFIAGGLPKASLDSTRLKQVHRASQLAGQCLTRRSDLFGILE